MIPKKSLHPVTVATVVRDLVPVAPMATYLLEVVAKVVVHSDEDSIEEFLENTYARIAEFVPSDEHIVNIELDAFPLPQEPGGSSDLGDGADHEEGGEAPVS
ncbi:MAG: hypothetical protein RLZZ515_2356 [Cyanobacteriota bacterium]